VHESSGAIQRLLIENRLNIVDRGCKVVSDTSTRQISLPLEQAKARLSTSAAAGLIGGVFASKLTAKVMTKSSVKISSKVLLMAVSKKAAGKAGGALAGAGVGAGIGALLGPIGAAVGAGLGAAVGVAVSVGIDIAALAIEEGLTRDSMRKDLIDAVTETLKPMRETFACK
jgi:phage-related tail protein